MSAIWTAVALALVGLQVRSVVRDELHRCPVCRGAGIADVERHCTIYHPGFFTPRYADDPALGVDPRPEETERAVFSRQMRIRGMNRP